jgi:hypothetical protein
MLPTIHLSRNNFGGGWNLVQKNRPTRPTRFRAFETKIPARIDKRYFQNLFAHIGFHSK